MRIPPIDRLRVGGIEPCGRAEAALSREQLLPEAESKAVPTLP